MVANLCIGALTPPLAVLVFTAARVTDTPIHLAYRACRPFMVGPADLARDHLVRAGAEPAAGAAVRAMSCTLTEDVVALPTGAWAGAHRRTLRHDGRPVLALTQGKHRAYVYPLFTPEGYAVTSEHPADHPHHNSFWIAADHVYCRMPVDARQRLSRTTPTISISTRPSRAARRAGSSRPASRGPVGRRCVPHHADARLARPGRMGGAGRAARGARDAHACASRDSAARM